VWRWRVERSDLYKENNNNNTINTLPSRTILNSMVKRLKTIKIMMFCEKISVE
jgi:hypothetical protein